MRLPFTHACMEPFRAKLLVKVQSYTCPKTRISKACKPDLHVLEISPNITYPSLKLLLTSTGPKMNQTKPVTYQTSFNQPCQAGDAATCKDHPDFPGNQAKPRKMQQKHACVSPGKAMRLFKCWVDGELVKEEIEKHQIEYTREGNVGATGPDEAGGPSVDDGEKAKKPRQTAGEVKKKTTEQLANKVALMILICLLSFFLVPSQPIKHLLARAMRLCLRVTPLSWRSSPTKPVSRRTVCSSLAIITFYCAFRLAMGE